VALDICPNRNQLQFCGVFFFSVTTWELICSFWNSTEISVFLLLLLGQRGGFFTFQHGFLHLGLLWQFHIPNSVTELPQAI
jgi:hypothetical protein